MNHVDLFSRLASVPPVVDENVDFEPFAREVAKREGLDPDEVVAEARRLLDKYALLWDQMRARGLL